MTLRKKMVGENRDAHLSLEEFFNMLIPLQLTEDFCLDLLHHMLGTLSEWRVIEMIETHIVRKVFCLILHHVQKILAFIFADL